MSQIPDQFQAQMSSPRYMLPEYPNTEPYLSYVALLNQTGTSDPISTILRNTFIRRIGWLRDSEGHYSANLTRMFPLGCVAVLTGAPTIGVGSRVFSYQRQSDDVLLFTTTLDGSFQDNLLIDTFIEIRIYFKK